MAKKSKVILHARDKESVLREREDQNWKVVVIFFFSKMKNYKLSVPRLPTLDKGRTSCGHKISLALLLIFI